MYLPYLRGKQFELIALRELSQLLGTHPDLVSPIIEPVKKKTNTLQRTLRELKEQNVNFNLVINPNLGDLVREDGEEIYELMSEELAEYNNYQAAFIIEEQTNIFTIIERLQRLKRFPPAFTLIHCAIRKDIHELIGRIEMVRSVVNNVIYFDKTSRRYYREFNADTRVGLEDFFKEQRRNADYLNIGDSHFSEEHIYYKEDGYKGFSDFLIIGDSYSETGFLPYAVAIHLSYVDSERKLRVRHFVSDSNDDTSDIGGKFAEALGKLIRWCDQRRIDSIAIQQFRKLHDTGHFPGLGVIKKLSIMHHIELVIKLLE